MSYEKKKKFIVNIAYYFIIASIIIFLLKYVLSWLMPFVIAFIVSAIIMPVSKKISSNLKVKKWISSSFCVFIFYAVAVLLIGLIGFNVVISIKNFIFDLPNIYSNNIEPTLLSALSFIKETLGAINPEFENILGDFARDFASNLGYKITNFSVSAISAFSPFIAKIPNYLIKSIITVISTFFISADYENILSFILRQIPEKWHILIGDIKEHTCTTILKYLKSYALIMIITFCEVSLALWLLRVDNFVVIAAVIALFDILPVLGSGGILIPWGIISLFQGRISFGVGILVSYGIITIVRQVIEPKIIGDQVGLHPLLTLISMFLGASIFGFVGLFGFPIALVIIKKLNDDGKIKLFKQLFIYGRKFK